MPFSPSEWDGYDARLIDDERRRLGVHYTPVDVVDGVLNLVLDPVLDQAEADGVTALCDVRVLDPSCGSGNFLVAAAERVADRFGRLGLDADTAGRYAMSTVVGVDLDPDAVVACRRRFADRFGTGSPPPTVVNGDALTMSLPQWRSLQRDAGVRHGFDVVIGNPPFLSQLASDTTFTAAHNTVLVERFGSAVQTYTDAAALFLLASLDVVKPDTGRMCLLSPTSTLATRDAAAVRAALQQRATMTAAWFALDNVFPDANVDVWAPLFIARSPSPPSETGRDGAVGEPLSVTVYTGRSFTATTTVTLPSQTTTFSPLLAAAQGVLQHDWETAGTVADVATATADFRDQYYGLVGNVIDAIDGDDRHPRLITAGTIDPATVLWGTTDTRFAKQRYRHPRVRLDTVDPKMAVWAEQRLVPKVLVATQTRMLEPVVDLEGRMLPSVPVVTVTPLSEHTTDFLWHLGAVFASPPVTAIAATRHLGTARSDTALKLSAKDLLALPLPADTDSWDDAAQHFRHASTALSPDEHDAALLACAETMCTAYGVGDAASLLAWWRNRWPRRRRKTDG